MLKAMSHAAIGLNFYSSSSPGHTTSPVIIAFTLGILICFVVGFCFIYLCRCCFMNYLYAWAFHRPTAGNIFHQIHSPTGGAASPMRGLDPALLQIFPTFPYASVKEFQRKNNNNKRYSLECAICLLEFEEDSVLRLLTVCCHVFHQECIDLWLESHKTCPVCRTDLDSSSKEKRHHQENQTIIEQPLTENNHNNNSETRIDVREEEEGEGKEEEISRRREEEEEVGEGEENNRFSRSHSTGHSIVLIKGEENDENKNGEDKYTLKLPEHVQIKLIRGHNYTQSCASYSEIAKLYSKCCYAEAISSTCTTSSCEPLRV